MSEPRVLMTLCICAEMPCPTLLSCPVCSCRPLGCAWCIMARGALTCSRVGRSWRRCHLAEKSAFSDMCVVGWLGWAALARTLLLHGMAWHGMERGRGSAKMRCMVQVFSWQVRG